MNIELAVAASVTALLMLGALGSIVGKGLKSLRQESYPPARTDALKPR